MNAILDRPLRQDSEISRFRNDVLRGLSHPQKELPCKYFYDARGSELFEQITTLPEYYLTRAESEIMERHAGEMAHALGQQCLLVEYGSGSSTKTRQLLDHLPDPVGYIPIDVSRSRLQDSARALAREYPKLAVQPLCVDFTQPFELPPGHRHVARSVVYFPGSTLGNFTPDEAIVLLRQIAALSGPEGGLLIGLDLKKDWRVLEAAYNDRAGVTAEFNRNILVRINRELDAGFDVALFDHLAFYNAGASRIEMHLMSRRRQRVRIGAAAFHFAAGESIRTEYSYKYDLDAFALLASRAGFVAALTWTDESRLLAVLYLRLSHENAPRI